MTARRRKRVRVVVTAFAGLLALYAGAVAIRILYPCGWLDLVRAQAAATRLDPALVCAVVRAESRFRPGAESPRGARGLMQLMPETAAWIAARNALPVGDLFDPEINLRLGTHYLRYLLDRYERAEPALAAYNAGPSRVDAWMAAGVTGYAETEAFVRRVQRSVRVYRILLAVPFLFSITPALPL
jgi:soluble lytic murein transglycosylase